MTAEITKIAVFKGKQIRKTIYNNEWWFSVVDVVQIQFVLRKRHTLRQNLDSY